MLDAQMPVEADVAAPACAPEPACAARIEARFVAQAAIAPERPAILFRGEVLSYGALDTLSNRIAQRLAAVGVAPGVLVALCMERSPAMIAAMLAILKAGGAYLPLDPAYPAERLSYMLADSAAAIMVTDGMPPAGLRFGGTVCDLAAGREAIAAAPDAPVTHGGSAADLAYVIYTSGSTGRPKGVMLAHSAVGLIDWLASAFDPAAVARIAACTSICFDPSIIEIFGTLGIGGLIVLKRDALEPFEPGECPTLLAAPPSVLSELARMRAIPDSVRILNVGGEAVTTGLVRLLFENSAAEEIHNHYGPTEATTCATVAPIARGALGDPTIGRPIAGARIYLLDEAGEPVEPGTTGEIHIAGETVALGYLGADPATRFRTDPFVPGQRMYRTGDLGALAPDGDLEFRGRIDTQVKLRGFRIELGEVEAALMRLQAVRQAVAVVQADTLGRDRLVAFVCADAPVNPVAVRRQLAAWLPAHMLPSRIVTLDRLPLASTGKVDRAALGTAPRDEGTAGAPPVDAYRSPTEAVIAAVFARHLDHAGIGPDDDLYDFGGDSLLAIEVALELEALLGKAVSPAMLAHDATPRALAIAIASTPDADASVLTRIQPHGTGPAIFCTPDLYGRSFSYVSLARRLAPSQPLSGLSPGDHAADFIARPDLRGLSRHYLAAIRAAQPAGPYIVSGYSFGAVQAFDLACLMEEEGESVRLILIDGAIARTRPSLRFLARWLREETPRTVGERGLVQTMRDVVGPRAIWSRVVSGSDRPVRPREIPRFVPQADRALAGALLQSVVDYRPRPFGGDCVMIRCLQPHPLSRLHDEDGWLGWRGLLPAGTQRFEVAGNHTRMMQEPLVADVQAIVQATLGLDAAR